MDEVSPSNEAVPGAPGSSNLSTVSSWCPRKLVFTAYSPPSGAANKTPNLRVVVRRPLVARLTKDIVETYRICNPQFKYSEDQNPKRYLTSPSVGVLNDGYDNSNSDLILTVNSVLVNPEATQQRYIVKDVLGQGTFGQVAKCWVPENGEFVAVKIIKNQPAYYQQALVEVSILTALNKKYDPEDKHHIVRIYDYFVHRRHLCICFELLETNLYELIKMNHFRGLSLSIVQLFSKQILRGLALLKDAGIIHCDLKPENILLCTSLRPADIKIIDFGSACMEDRTVYSYIQSRYYRSPEVLLGYQYTTAIDMWSFGCIVAELFLGLPLFAGASEFDLLQRMIKIIGGQPPDYLLKEAKNTTKFFKCIGNVYNPENAETSTSGRSIYQAISEEEYEVREHKKATIGKEYFHHRDLEAIVKNYPYRKNLPKEDIVKETQIRLALIDFLRGLVEFDPLKRWSPLQASRHPFVTGEPFMSPYQPPPETPRMLVGHQNMKVSHHHPGGGHWFAAGLSPNVAVWNHQVPTAPSYGGTPHAHAQHANSYGSLGSHHGSYNESVAGLGTSYGSHGGDGVMFQYYSPVGPSAMNHLNTTQQGGSSSAMMLGSSPDRRRRNMQQQFSYGLGVSPSGGNFAPLPLGTSPSQFTPPSSSSYNQFSPGQGHYGPTSPARGSIQGSPLGKGAVMNRRMGGWGYSSSPQENSPTQQQQHFRGSEGGSISQAAEEVASQNISSSNGPLVHQHSNSNPMSSWKQQPFGRNGVIPASNIHATSVTKQSSIRMYQQQQTSASEMAETNIIPDPGDWDPHFSVELLLQEDGTETGTTALASEFAEMQLSSTDLGVRRLNHAAKTVSSSISINTSNHQREGSSSHGGELGKYASPPADQQQYSISGHVRPPAAFKPPPHSLPHHQYYNNPLSRLGQQQQQQHRVNHGIFGQTADWNHSSKSQHPPHQIHHHHNISSSFISSGGGIHQSPGNSSSLVNGISSSWGGRGGGGGYRGGDGPTASRGRKDYGRLV